MGAWREALLAEYKMPKINRDLECEVCVDDQLCKEAADVLVQDIAVCWEGDIEDVYAWVFIRSVNIGGQTVSDSQEQFLEYREEVASAIRHLSAEPVAA